ncbi:MAG: lactate racemase domain-containing protein, partial [bacterium]|nr:lactate racemase domain-containing protein [bacterium]
KYDMIISVGQVVPHEVIGMANGNKNILVGVGGKDTINKTHFLGAVCNMERIMGRADNPVRAVCDYAEERYLSDLPIVYVQTVMGECGNGEFGMAGLFIGRGRAPFREAAALSQRLNITRVKTGLKKVVVYLDEREFKSTWLGNKAIYRTRMAMADGGELVILGPGVEMFGEDGEIDRLIRRYGYRGTEATLAAVEREEELRENLSAAAHLIHGSSEGRFRIRYAPGKMRREEIEGVGYEYGDLGELMARYDPEKMQAGENEVEGEKVFFIKNPALGLWAVESAFEV